jgi:hypothetical protein
MANDKPTNLKYESIRKLVREHIFKYGISEDFLSDPEPVKPDKRKKSTKKK